MLRRVIFRYFGLLFLMAGGGVAQAPSRKELEFLSSALPAIEAQRWPDAEAILRDGLAVYPRSAVLSNALGMVYHSEHKDAEALTAFQNAVAWLPNFTAAQLHLGSLLVEEGDCRRATPLLTAAGAGTTERDALATAGAGLAQCREFAAAAGVFARAHEMDPQSAESSFNLALARFENGEFDKALEALNAIADEADRKRPEVLLLRGKLLQVTKQAGAEGALAAACAARAEEDSCNEAAVALIRQERYSEAAELLGKTVQALPRSAALLTTLGLTQFRLGRYREAVESYQRAIQLDLKLEAPREGLGFLLYVTGDLQQARAVTEAGLRAPKGDFYLSYLRALVLYRMGRQLWLEASKSIEDALAGNSGFAPAYFLRGKIRMEQGELDGALGDFQKAVALDPKYALPHYKMAQVYDRQGLSEKAEQARARFAELGSLREEEVLARETQSQVLGKP